MVAISSITPTSSTRIRVAFDEAILEPAALRCPGIYAITPTAPITDLRSSLQVLNVEPELVVAPTYVDLTIEEMTDGQAYGLTMSTIGSGAGAVMEIFESSLASFTPDLDDRTLVLIRYSGAGPVTVTLPEGEDGQEVVLQKTNTSGHVINVTLSGTDQFQDGTTALVLTGDYATESLIFSDTIGRWVITSGTKNLRTLSSNSTPIAPSISDDVVISTYSGAGPVVINLPAGVQGKHFRIKKTTTSTHTITINANGADRFEEGSTPLSLTGDYAEVSIFYNSGTARWMIDGVIGTVSI